MEISKTIDDLKKQMQEVKGTPCEVFSRVCGYLRPVQNYNAGKREEFNHRVPFKVEKCEQ